MNATDLAPVTARDALITELLSDVGNLHDAIKALPKTLELSMTDTIMIVANAVDEAEKTSVMLQQSTNELMRAASSKVGIDIGMELASAIHQSLEKVFEPSLSRAAGKIEALDKQVSAMSASTRDLHATRFNQIMLIGFVVMALFMIGAMGWAVLKAQDVNETNKWFYEEYKTQRSVIETLPADVRQRFKK